jgi:hypothetical protein
MPMTPAEIRKRANQPPSQLAKHRGNRRDGGRRFSANRFIRLWNSPRAVNPSLVFMSSFGCFIVALGLHRFGQGPLMMTWTQVAALLTPFAMLGFVALVVAKERSQDEKESTKAQQPARR